MRIEEYLTEVKNQIRDKKAREFVGKELQDHIEDRAEGLQKKGMDHDRAILQAVEEMGDPVSVGVNLDFIHRPRLEWRFLLYIIYISILGVGTMCLTFSAHPYGNVEYSGFVFQQLSGVLLGVIAMIIVYRLDYTILAGRSRLIAGAFLILLTFLAIVFGVSINGARRWIELGGMVFSTQVLFILYLPIFAGILYDYRNKGIGAIFKIILWMIAPVFSLILYGRISLNDAMLMLSSEIILFAIALNKNWYRVDKSKFLKITGIIFVTTTALSALRIASSSGYQNARFKAWLSHIGIAVNSADEKLKYMNYTNSCLDNIFLKSRFIGKSESAMESVYGLPESMADFVLAPIAATCGKAVVALIIVSLIVLAIYVFSVSVKQKNSLGSIVGFSCGIVIAIQAVSNFLIVFGLLPLAGTTLPFFSIGTGHIVVEYVLLGIVLSIYRYQDIRVENNPTIAEAA